MPALPEIFVMIMACVTLLAGVFFDKIKQLSYILAQITIVIAGFLTWYSFAVAGHSMTSIIFHNSFILDKLAFVLKEVVYLLMFMTFVYSRQYNDERRMPANEFYVLGLLSMLGMMVLISSHSFLTVFLGVELMSLPIYAMVALQRGKERCIEAAMKYFVTGALATGLLLYGMSMIFGATKTLDISTVAQVITTIPVHDNLILLFGLVFVLAGMAFKLGAAPFHMWVPDVYDGAPNSTTIFIGAAPKIAAFAMLIRVLVEALPALSAQWSSMIIVLALLSMLIGNFAAIVQTNFKRMLAYSSIAHIGYMLLGIACATTRGYSAAMFYIISYSVMTLGAFGMVALLSREGFEANEIDDLAGLGSRNPWLAFMLMIMMFSMAGIPPLIGFIAKVGIFEALIQAHLVWLAVLAILFAIVGAYYYIRVVKVMYFEDSATDMPRVVLHKDANIVITLNGLAILVLGIFPGALFALCRLTF